MESFDAFLTAHPLDSLREPDRSAVNSTIATVRSSIATVRAVGSMVGASVTADVLVLGVIPVERA